MAKRGKPCDCCGAPRNSWQRLCPSCYATLPSYIRNLLISAWKSGDRLTWRRQKRIAKAYLASPATSPASSTAVYDRTARLLGERD